MINYAGLIALLCLAGTSYARLRSGLTACSITLSKEEFSRCVARKFPKLASYLKNDHELLNLPSLDPYRQVSLKINRTTFVIKDLRVTGILNYDLQNIDVDPHNLTLEANINFPQLKVEGNYNAGNFSSTLYDIDFHTKVQAKIVTFKSGIERFEIDKFNNKLRIDSGKLKLVALPKYAKAEASIEKLFNTYSRLFLEIFKSHHLNRVH